ncbi:hypothetical protein [Rhodoplanes sp. Z2-YC6860]|uniref:hypothetical protein n=1 Tax=Rhodoplanes sp. Z2-YC6860 TaxID=674703 RepID=UPI0012EDE8B8|nr:hypothetical protein [Rhodoplanes sp. Z2-YC6860]
MSFSADELQQLAWRVEMRASTRCHAGPPARSVQPNDSISVMKRLQIAWMMLAPITSSGRIFVLL